MKAVEIGGLKVDAKLYHLVRNEIAPGTGVNAERFWKSLGEIVRDLGPKNRALLDKRDRLQAQIDQWHTARKNQPFNSEEYTAFLKEIGYLVPEGKKFKVTTANVDPEITEIAGAQLVVPLDNARYALNAANARWGSLYDALYGTNVIPEEGGAEKGESYNPRRGAKVIAYAEELLDKVIGLKRGSFSDVARFFLRRVGRKKQLAAALKDGSVVALADGRKFLGYQEKNGELTSILLSNNGSRIEIQIDKNHPIGKAHPAGVKDVVLDSGARTVRRAFEDQVFIRRAALVQKNRSLGFPTITFPCEMTADPMKEALIAATFIAKYAGIIVLSDFQGESIFPLLVARLNIYTDPQRPMMMKEGIYPIGSPTEGSPVLITTNFALTYFIVSGEIEASRVPSWLLVMDTEGLSVLTAWAAGKFVGDAIGQFVKKSGITEKVNHKKIVIPGFVAAVSGDMEEELGPEWEVRIGPREAAHLAPFLKMGV